MSAWILVARVLSTLIVLYVFGLTNEAKIKRGFLKFKVYISLVIILIAIWGSYL